MQRVLFPFCFRFAFSFSFSFSFLIIAKISASGAFFDRVRNYNTNVLFALKRR